MAFRCVEWTPALDAELKRLRLTLTWDEVTAAMGLGRNTVLERGRRIGARKLAIVPEIAEDPNRPPMEPGNAVSWAVINEGLQTDLGPYQHFQHHGLGRKKAAPVAEAVELPLAA